MDLLTLLLLVIIVTVVIIVIVNVSKRNRVAASGLMSPGPAHDAPYNTMAIIAFVTSFLVSIVGIVLGHLALGDIRRRRERGAGLAIAALVIGYLALVGTIIYVGVVLWATFGR